MGRAAMDSSFIGLSSAATRLEDSAPHRLQRWMTAHSPPFRTRHRFHQSAAVRRPVSGLDIQVEAGEAVGAVVPVAASGPLRAHGPAAGFTGEGILAGMGFVIAFFKSLSLVLPVHGMIPPDRIDSILWEAGFLGVS